MKDLYADIILPLSVKGRFTYAVPLELADVISVGSVVLVPFGGNKIYAGTVTDIHDKRPDFKNIKPVINTAQRTLKLNDKQLKLWEWISLYYMCSEGEVMKAALPSAFMPDSDKEGNFSKRYKAKEELFVRLREGIDEKSLNELIDSPQKAPKQIALLMEYLSMGGYDEKNGAKPVKKSDLLVSSGVSAGPLNGLVKKNILECYPEEVSRLSDVVQNTKEPSPLSSAQQKALNGIKSSFVEKDVVLLHGVTSSGKTELYIHLIQEELAKGKQVLYMLPEIALTTQIINRLRGYFGLSVGVYHSRFNDLERVEIWEKTKGDGDGQRYGLILGVRSSLFLPFDNLGLIIVDEEHDSSYKQQDPAPRYNARDTAIMLASFHKAKTLLGSASPSVESYVNASLNGKYGLVELNERYGAIRLPDIVLADTREAYRKKLMVSHFTPELLSAMDEALGKGEQIVLFQNRRGFAPYVECTECGWIPRCDNCSVSLTYHKSINKLVCHYCGKTIDVPYRCGNCESTSIKTKGFGTEKIEDEIKIVFPDARVGRMDQDTTKGKNGFDRIIKEFEEGRIDILAGTQMISKGLDFENLTVVGILNADNLLNFPDFRAHERGYQLIEQVSGRAGRRQKRGKVVIQTSDPRNKVIRQLLNHDFLGMFSGEIAERKTFDYPPFRRMIRINLRHKDMALLDQVSGQVAVELRKLFADGVLGPEYPLVSRVQLWYIKTILIKLEANKEMAKSKKRISEVLSWAEKLPGASSLKIAVDVDPS